MKIRDLAELQEVVWRSLRDGEPLILVGENDEELVFDLPQSPPKTHDKTEIDQTDADRQAFLASAGGWKGLVDGEKLKAQIRKSRGSDRPIVRFVESSE